MLLHLSRSSPKSLLLQADIRMSSSLVLHVSHRDVASLSERRRISPRSA
jgi:hypothetical protein